MWVAPLPRRCEVADRALRQPAPISGAWLACPSLEMASLLVLVWRARRAASPNPNDCLRHQADDRGFHETGTGPGGRLLKVRHRPVRSLGDCLENAERNDSWLTNRVRALSTVGDFDSGPTLRAPVQRLPRGPVRRLVRCSLPLSLRRPGGRCVAPFCALARIPHTSHRGERPDLLNQLGDPADIAEVGAVDRRRVELVTTVVALSVTLLFLLWLVVRIGGENGVRYFDDIVTGLAALSACVACLLAGTRQSGSKRRFWMLLASALGAWTFAEVI